MNHVYRVVFNHSLGVYQCVSELAKSCGKSSGKSQVAAKLLLTPLAMAVIGLSGTAMAADFEITDGQRTEYQNTISINGNVLISEPGTVIATPNNQINFSVNPIGQELTIDTNVSIENGAAIEAGVSSSVGVDRFAKVTVDNAQFTTPILAVGVRSNGELHVINNGKLNTSDIIRIAFGSNLSGRLEVRDSGSVDTVDLLIGDGKDSTSNVLIDGTGSIITVADYTSVGDDGLGNLFVQNGGTFSSKDLAISALAGSAGSKLTVNGVASTADIKGTFLVGSVEEGSLDITAGGKVKTASLSISDSSTANGTINLSGSGSTLDNSVVLVVGREGNGTINISNKAILNSSLAGIGQTSNAIGKVSLTNGAIWNNKDILTVGFDGKGTLTATGERTKVTTSDLAVGNSSGKGNVRINDKAVVEVTRLLQIGGYSLDSENAIGELTVDNATLIAPITIVGALGSGTLNIINNGVVKTESVERFPTSKKSEINFDNGTIELTQSQPLLFNDFTGDNTIKLGAGGGTIDTAGFNTRLFENTMLAGNGAVITGSGDFTKAGTGLLAMATTAKQWTGATNINQGTLRLDGNYTMRDGEVLGIGLNTLDDYGQLVVQGSANISQGQLEVNASEAVANLSGNNEWKDIVKATTRVGEFTKISDNSPLVSFYADYSDPNAVHLKMGAPTPPVVTPEPPVVTPEPPVVTPEPPVVTPEPPVVTPEPPVVTPEPPVVTPEPPVVTPEPPVVTPEPPVVTPEPPVVTPEPPVVTPEPPVTDTTFVESVNTQSQRNDVGIAYALDRAIQDQISNGDNDLAKALISSTTNFNQNQLAAAANQLQPLFMGATNRIVTDTNYAASEAVTEHRATTTERNVWAKLIGNTGSHDAENGVTGYEADSYGAIVGLDMPINSDLNLGVAVSYIDTDADTDGGRLDHKLTAKNWQVLGYGNYAASDATNVNFHAGAGSSAVKGERHLSILTNAIARSDYDVDTLRAGLGVDHRIGSEQRHITPFAQVNYAQAKSDSYRETGAGVYNLNVNENRYESMRWTAGLKMSQYLTPQFAITGQLAAAIENGDQNSDITASFVGMSNDRFTTIGQEVGREIGIVGIGVSYMPTLKTTLSAGYRSEWRENYDDQGASIALQTTF